MNTFVHTSRGLTAALCLLDVPVVYGRTTRPPKLSHAIESTQTAGTAVLETTQAGLEK